MKEINFQEMAHVLNEWNTLSPGELAKRITPDRAIHLHVERLKNQSFNMAHFMELLHFELPRIKETLENFLHRDYILRTEAMCVYILPFHFEGHREILEKAEIPTDQPITTVEALSAVIFQILTRTSLNVQMVWQQPKRTGTLFVDDKNFRTL